MAEAAESLQYYKIWLADFFHGFPHLGLELEETDSTFDPEDEDYQKVGLCIFFNLYFSLLKSCMDGFGTCGWEH